jgi:hypothetical protein
MAVAGPGVSDQGVCNLQCTASPVRCHMSACATTAFQSWLQVHSLTPSTYSQSKFQLDNTRSAAYDARSCVQVAPLEGVLPSAIREWVCHQMQHLWSFHGHLLTKADKRLLCDVCKSAQTGLKCQSCGVYMCKLGSGRQCIIRRLLH